MDDENPTRKTPGRAFLITSLREQRSNICCLGEQESNMYCLDEQEIDILSLDKQEKKEHILE
jgi:hypothetical protein